VYVGLVLEHYRMYLLVLCVYCIMYMCVFCVVFYLLDIFSYFITGSVSLGCSQCFLKLKYNTVSVLN
jgi:hypothetical protein